jgi:pSer/pThr/pTyr-binding forkhead associated (FHA) protein
MKLELISVDRQKAPIILYQFPVIVGLDPGADVCLDDSAVGHYQCMIDDSDGVLMVWDLGTKLGTFINQQRVSPKAPLLPGDELAFGRHRFVARYGDGTSKSARRAEHGGRSESRIVAPSRRQRQPVGQV